MKASYLSHPIEITPVANGQYRISATYRGQVYTCITANQRAVEVVTNATRYVHKHLSYALKKYYRELYDEIKQKNQIGEL